MRSIVERIAIGLSILLFILGMSGIFLSNKTPTLSIGNTFIDENDNIVVNFDIAKYGKNKVYCLYKKESDTKEDWILSINNNCTYKLSNEKFSIYLKDENNNIFKITDANSLGKIKNMKLNKEEIFIAKDGVYRNLSLEYESIGNINDSVVWFSEDENIAKVSDKGIITGVNYGTVKVGAKIGTFSVTTDVTVTKLLVKAPKSFNKNKSFLPCGKYNKEENDLLDKILADRVNDVGYKTRAATVEVARFITLEFPYKVRYFSENGRLTINKVDGEGRYYHKGLYLDESRFVNISKSRNGPQTWGCKMYSNPSHGIRPNGLDCSGFITWVMLNGGFDVGDVGAGVTAGVTDMTDYGVKTKFDQKVVDSGKVRVGDLLSSTGPGGGHIAIIVGEDNNYYYVAESLWTPPNISVLIMPYSKKTIWKRYYWVMLMDSYYKEEGKLTNLWY